MKASGWQTALGIAMIAAALTVPLNWPVQQSQGNGSQNTQDSNKQQKDKKNSKDNSSDKNPNSGDKPAPLFGGSLNVKSSRQTKDTATLGFNGVDDNGQVQKSFLSATASGADTSAVQRLASPAVTPSDLDEFIQQGGLNTIPPPKKPANPPVTGDKQ